MTTPEPRRIGIAEGASQALIDAMVDQCHGGLANAHLTTWFAEPARGERRITVDQTNTSVVVGERAVVKWLNHPTPGRHPAPERLQLLAQAAYRYTPRPWGLLEDDAGALLAIVTSFVPGAIDGWEWGPELVRSLARQEITMAEALAPMLRIGELVAGMHEVFAEAGVEKASTALVHAWYDAGVAALDAAQVGMASLVGESGDETVLLRSLAERARLQLRALRESAGTPLMVIHGDLHLGQILRATPSANGTPTEEFMIIDFDGNPVLPLPQRLATQPAALDVAGMLCSIDHIGRVVMYRTPEHDPGLVQEWMRRAEESFMNGYLDNLHRPELLDEEIIPALRVQQECREYLYAAQHLPHWRYVPHAALPALLDQLNDPSPRHTNPRNGHN